MFLAEVGESVRKQLEKTGALQEIGEENVLPAGDRMQASLQKVYNHAQTWLEEVPDSDNIP